MARREDQGMELFPDHPHSPEPWFSMVAASVLHNDRRLPLEFGGPVERKAAFPGVPPAFRLVELDVHVFYCLPDKIKRQGLHNGPIVGASLHRVTTSVIRITP